MPLVSESAWIISSNIERQLKAKIDAIGTPLKEWDINIYRGVLTGFNEAFIIDTETKERLCFEDAKSVEIIKPILRGRDIKRYRAEWSDLWIIATFPTLHLNIDDYPAIKNYLLSFGFERLEQSGKVYKDFSARKKTNNKWFEVQDTIAYWQEFEKEKIVWARLTRIHKTEDTNFPRFSLVKAEHCVADTVCFITADSYAKYLLAVLNSKYAENYFYKSIAMLDDGGMQMRQHYIEQFPIPKLSQEKQKPFIDLVDKILANKKASKETSELENQIDRLVYSLYDLNEQEIKLINNTQTVKKS